MTAPHITDIDLPRCAERLSQPVHRNIILPAQLATTKHPADGAKKSTRHNHLISRPASTQASLMPAHSPCQKKIIKNGHRP